jgi:hypothetical protein
MNKIKDFVLYKVLRRKKPEVEPVVEPEKFDIQAILYMKSGRIHRVIGRYESSKDLMNDIMRIMETSEHLTAINTNDRRVIVRTEEIDYVEVETKAYEA